MTSLRVVSGNANPGLAAGVAELLDVEPPTGALERFPDGEIRPVVEHVGGADVYVVQPTAPPVNDNFVELLLLLDACRRSRAARVTAVVPYFGYARQSRRTRAGQALGLRVVAEAIAGAGADRLVVVDPHTAALESASPIPIEILTAVPLLAERISSAHGGDTVIVAPDAGAAKLAEQYAAVTGDAVALVRKHRENGTRVTAIDLLGEVQGRAAVIVDDMISTGATLEAAVEILRYRARDIVVAATHGPLAPAAAQRLRELGVRRILVTDTVSHDALTPPFEVCSVAPLLASAITSMHSGHPLHEVFARA
ncbi:ribose-phosphate pyrophosphokinase [Nocardia sp. CDC153]|uniref:ribose-phosphate diphosphokinase n=1 Tax=Nocardia sp. CDC153 TaxID=3112167 RepID=UPI002DB9F361|nr:ribose-phosphate pyrophosphokinase [Nocardia sp. CDC153]MEC3953727.1 ribose-phosphate pyrophosphokinase [Nocardia sp. CDC153]